MQGPAVVRSGKGSASSSRFATQQRRCVLMHSPVQVSPPADAEAAPHRRDAAAGAQPQHSGTSLPVNVAPQRGGLVPAPLCQAGVQVVGEAGVVESLPVGVVG